MRSPYFNNVGSNWGPPSGLADLLLARKQGQQRAGEQIGDFAGMMATGVGSGIRAARDPGMSMAAFGGADAGSKGSRFWKGFGAGVNQSTGAGPGFGQLALLGKSADMFVKGMGGDEWLQAQGIDPAEYKTWGSEQKTKVAAGYMQAQGAKLAMQKLAQLNQEMEASRVNTQAQYVNTLATANRLNQGNRLLAQDQDWWQRFARIGQEMNQPGLVNAPVDNPMMTRILETTREAGGYMPPEIKGDMAKYAENGGGLTPGTTMDIGIPGYRALVLNRGTVSALPTGERPAELTEKELLEKGLVTEDEAANLPDTQEWVYHGSQGGKRYGKVYRKSDNDPLGLKGVLSGTDDSGAPAAKDRVKVKGPNGEKGTVPRGTKLPPGWKLR